MAISLDDFKKQYGTQPTQQAPVQAPVRKSSQPISIDEFKQQYSVKSETAQPSRQELIKQGQPVSTQARFEKTGKATPSVGGTIVRGALKPLATIPSTATSGFRKPEEGEGFIQSRPMKSKYFGDVKPLQEGLARGLDKGVQKVRQGDIVGGIGDTLLGAGASTAAGVGTALEVGSYALGAKPFTSGVKALPQLKRIAGTEAIAGGMQQLGATTRDVIEEGKPFGESVGEVAKNTAIGTATGAVAGPILGGLGRLLGFGMKLATPSGRTQISDEAVSRSVESMKELFSTQRGKKFIGNVDSRMGDEPFKFLVESGATRDLGVVNNRVVTNKAVNKVNDSAVKFENLLQESLDPAIEPRLVSVNDIAERVIKNINESSYTSATKEGMRKQAIDEIQAIVRETGEQSFNLNRWNEIKRSFWREAFPESKLVTDADKLSRDRKYLVGRGIMEAIEDFADNPDIKELNRVLGVHAESRKILNEMSKQVLTKGQLGRYVLQGIGTGVGTAAGGPFGGLVGALGGDLVTNVLQKLSVNSPVRAGLIKYIRQYRPDLINKLDDFLLKRGNDVMNAPRLPQGATVTPQRDTSGILPRAETESRLTEMGVLPAKVRESNLPKPKR